MGQGRRREGSNENKIFVTWELRGCEVREREGRRIERKWMYEGLFPTTMRDRRPWNSLNHLFCLSVVMVLSTLFNLL